MPSSAGTAFVRFVALGRWRTFIFAHALRHHLQSVGVDPRIVRYRHTLPQAGYLNEVDVAARLDVESWREVARWCRQHFRSLHVDDVITGQLEKLSRYGLTGEEPYEKVVT